MYPIKFSAINFKYTDAKNEKVYSPDVLREAYVDLQGSLKKVLDPDKFIVYGDKGSGKTAIGCYYELKSQQNPKLLAKVDDLEDFDFSLVSPPSGQGRAYPQTTSAWKFLLALRLFILLSEDQLLRQENPKLEELVNDLTQRGMLPSSNLSKLASGTFSKGGEFALKLIADLKLSLGGSNTWETKSASQIGDGLIQSLKEIRPTGSQYLLFVDGLDHVLRSGKDYISTIGDLISAAKIVNEELLATRLSAKIVVLIRDEVARAIPNPDLSKRLSDNGICMNWYDNPKKPFDSDLLKIIELRAHLVGFRGSIDDLWRGWFPEKVNNIPTAKYILSRTRFLPRDIIQFFNALQDQLNHREPPIWPNTIISAERKYSQWLFDELNDSLVGLLDDKVRNSLSGMFSELGRFFTVDDLQKSLSDRGLSGLITSDELSKLLFDTHWIGNKSDFYVFKSRNRAYGFSSKLECVLAEGLVRGLSLDFKPKNK